MFYNNKSTLVEDSEDFFQDQGSDLSLPHLEEDEGESYSHVSVMHREWRTAFGALALLNKPMS